MAFPSSNPTPISSSKPSSLIIPPFHSTTALFFPLSLSIHSNPQITRFRHLHITNSSTPTITVSPPKPSVTDVTLNPPRKGCDILVEALEREGVTHVFAYPGACTIDIHQSLTHSSIIRTILPRHEQGGVFAAEGYARASGLPGVCIATSGPGATNLVSGIADAMFDSIPIVAITGQVPRGLIGTDAFQEAPVVELTSPITKRNYQVWNVEDIPRIVREAFYLAKSGRPGPVLIDIPKDISEEFAVPNWDQPMKLTDYMLTLPNPVNKSCLERILRLIGESEKPVLYVGGGCLDSSNELRRFVELTGIPVASTLMGLGSFPSSDNLSLQMLGLYGTYYANYAVDNSDLLLAFGVRFDDHVTGKLEAFASRAKIVHIDIDPSELGKNKQPDVSICGDIKIALQGLNEILEKRNFDRDFDFSSWRHELNEQKTSHPMKFETNGDAIPPQYAIQVLDELTGGNAIIATGVGNHQMWSAQFYKYDRPRQWLTSGGLGAMGFGLPAAMGACLARPEAVVVDIDGDGSFMMNVQELATIRAENLPVKIMVINNQCLGMPVQFEDRLFNGNRGHTFLGNPSKVSEIFPDMVKFAEACDIPAMRVMKKEKVRSAIKEMLDTPGPYLLDVVISHKEFVFPVIPNGGTFMDVITDADAW